MDIHNHIPMDSPERCERTELIKTQCGHCQPARTQFVEVAAPEFLGFDMPGGDDDTIVATFPARFGGRCGRCDGFFDAGDWIARTSSGDYLCPDCTEQ